MKLQKIIIGTAGHVDHGKSALAKALTGVDPDRLPEEKTREMTIDLGFVFFSLNEQEEAAIIDVPGHERFLRTMIAGAASIRIVLFVVAADEGVMPQTIEHLDVLKLLGIEQGIIVITKIDKVDKEYIALVGDDIKKLVKGSFLENAPVFNVSSVTQQGIDELKKTLIRTCQDMNHLSADGIFRCPIDRIFTMKGFGSIVAGTVISGRLKKTETIEILPIGKKTRIRNLQVHNQIVDEIFAGQRAAFNISDISVAEIVRGYELSVPDYLKPTQMIEARISLLANAPRSLKNNQRVRLHKGTAEVMTRVRILDKEAIEPGEQGLVQMKLEKLVVGERKERFLIRSYSPMKVIGGGRLLNLFPHKRGTRLKKERIAYLKRLEEIKDDDLIEMAILYAKHPIAKEKELMYMLNIPMTKITPRLESLLKEKRVLKLRDNALVHRKSLDHLKERCLGSIEQFVKANPLKVVMKRGELVKKLRVLSAPLVDKIFEELNKEGKIEMKAEGVRIAGMGVSLSSDAQRIADAIEKFILEKEYKPVRFSEITNAFPNETRQRIKNVFDYLLRKDIITELLNEAYLHREILERAKVKLFEHLEEKGTIRAVEYRDVLGVSRNTARDILDFFFDQGITIRTKGTHRLAHEKT